MKTTSQKIILKASDGLGIAGHSTDIFKNELYLMDEIICWLKEIYFVPSAERTVSFGSGLGQS